MRTRQVDEHENEYEITRTTTQTMVRVALGPRTKMRMPTVMMPMPRM